jgi:Ras-related protein Rab-5C
MYYRSSHVAVLVYDVTSESTLDGLEDWKAEIVDKAPPNVKLIVVGNKVDLGEGRLIRSTAGQKLAKRFNAVSYIETSAQTGVGIQELFFGIAELDLTRDSADGETARPSGEGGGCCG